MCTTKLWRTDSLCNWSCQSDAPWCQVARRWEKHEKLHYRSPFCAFIPCRLLEDVQDSRENDSSTMNHELMVFAFFIDHYLFVRTKKSSIFRKSFYGRFVPCLGTKRSLLRSANGSGQACTYMKESYVEPSSERIELEHAWVEKLFSFFLRESLQFQRRFIFFWLREPLDALCFWVFFSLSLKRGK